MAKKATKKKPAKNAVKQEVKTVLVEWKPSQMDDKEIASAFLVPVDDRLRQAYTQLLDEAIEASTEQAENPALSNHHGLLANANGQLLALRGFRDLLRDRFDTAHDVLSNKTEQGKASRGY